MKENINEKIKPNFTEKDLNSPDLQFHHWRTLEYLVGLIKSSELKAGLILSFYGIIFNFVYQNVESAKQSLTDYNFLYVLLILWLVCTLKSMYHGVRTFIPRIETKYDDNIFFFGDIVSKFGDINKYSNTFLKTAIDKEKIYSQLGHQIFINAKITTEKFKNVNTAVRFLVFSLIALFLLVLSEIIIMLFA